MMFLLRLLANFYNDGYFKNRQQLKRCIIDICAYISESGPEVDKKAIMIIQEIVGYIEDDKERMIINRFIENINDPAFWGESNPAFWGESNPI